MSQRLGPLEVSCDAPPYSIVQACGRVGIQSPEDVRWLRLSQFLHQQSGWPKKLLFSSWKLFWGASDRDEPTCTCGHRLPRLMQVDFTFTSGDEASYQIGQCRRCRTIFWDPD